MVERTGKQSVLQGMVGRTAQISGFPQLLTGRCVAHERKQVVA